MYEAEKQLVLDTALTMGRYQLVALSGGNVTIRMPNDQFLITPSGMVYEEMVADDVLLVDFDGNVVEGHRKPSVDTQAILYIFREMPWVNCVIHTHQPYATAVGLVDDEFPACLTTMLDATRGPVKVAPYLPSADTEMGRLTVEYAGESRAVILKHHGVMTFGKDVHEALMAAVYMEEAAKTYMAARPIKKFESFAQEEIEHARYEADRYGQVDVED